MTDPGLDQRLRQRSRRAGFMIGISMALTIAVCIGGFSVIYAALDDTFGDFLSREVEAPVVPTDVPTREPESQGQQASQAEDPDEEAAEPTDASEPEPTDEPGSTEEAEEFVPDYQTSSDYSVNFRSEPSADGGETTIIVVLPPETPLMFTGEDAPTDNPQDGDLWMQFTNEDGETGWVRELDISEYEP